LLSKALKMQQDDEDLEKRINKLETSLKEKKQPATVGGLRLPKVLKNMI
jgi:cell division septum initiation protein DivIVA